MSDPDSERACVGCGLSLEPADSSLCATCTRNNVSDGQSVSALADEEDERTESTSSKSRGALRKSTRSRSSPKQTQVTTKQASSKGRSRRAIFKRDVYRSPSAFVSPVASDHIFFKGQYYQAGDIVSVEDVEGGTYYAQLRGFLQDQYCEKSAALTWLVPTLESPEDGSFDPSTFVLGPEEDFPRKLEVMKWLMHAPSDYFRNKKSPYPIPESTDCGYIWTRIGPSLAHRNDTHFQTLD